MTCPRCRHDNPGDAVFCQECGTRLDAACPSCATPNQLTAKFCKKCGHRLSGPETEPAIPGPRFGAPESYTPKHLAERILTSKAALEGERKQVTVLFADLKGSMELLADRDPEEARKLLDPVLPGNRVPLTVAHERAWRLSDEDDRDACASDARGRTRLGRRHAQASVSREDATGLGRRATPPTRR